MKKIIFSVLAMLLSCSGLLAQGEVQSSEPGLAQEQTSKRAMSVFAEAGGAGLNILSFNFDTRFNKTPDGLGGRIGFSYLTLGGVSLTTVPLSVNYLLGKNSKYFEIGIGATAAFASADRTTTKYLFDGSEKEEEKSLFKASRLTGTLTIGYRKQPVDGGFMYGLGFTPIFGKFDGKFYFIPYFPYLQLGYTF